MPIVYLLLWCTIVLNETLGHHASRLDPVQMGVALHLVLERKLVVWSTLTMLQGEKFGGQTLMSEKSAEKIVISLPVPTTFLCDGI